MLRSSIKSKGTLSAWSFDAAGALTACAPLKLLGS